MEKFTTLTAIAAPMMVPNIDTDAIIPVEQMKALDADFGKCLFFNQRYRLDGSDNPDFLLNRPSYRKARSWSRARISAAAPRVSTRSGR